MDRKHCDICNKELGHKPPFFTGETQWATLDTPNSHWEYCLAHEKKVDAELSKIKKKLIDEHKGDSVS